MTQLATTISPERAELNRLETQQQQLHEQVVSEELALETLKTELAQFQHRYFSLVGQYYVTLDVLDSQLLGVQAALNPKDEKLQAAAAEAMGRCEGSQAEAQAQQEAPKPAQEITAELKQTYRQAAKLMHPDRATNDAERSRRTALMAQVNAAYEAGDSERIQRLIDQFGNDTEAVTDENIGARLVKAIRRIAQYQKRLETLASSIKEIQNHPLISLKNAVTEDATKGIDSLGTLSEQLQNQIAEKQAVVNAARKALQI